MSIEKTVEQHLTEAMKAKDAQKVSTLRLLKAALGNYKIEKKKNSLEDNEVVEILQRQIKQRKESVESYEKGGRTELSEKETQELAILQVYLPTQLADSEIKSLAQKAITQSGAKTKAELGKVMKELMPSLKGKADGKRVNEIVLSLLT